MAVLAIVVAIKGTAIWFCLSALAYIAIAVVTNWQPTNSNGVTSLSDGHQSPEETILEIIRAKGQAQRHDFLAVLKLSRTSLGRVLDEMEEAGQIRQIGERKSAFYALK